MSLIDALIPGILGLVLLLWPQSVFVGSKATPTPAKLTLMRRVGGLLVAVGAVFLVIGLVGR